MTKHILPFFLRVFFSIFFPLFFLSANSISNSSPITLSQVGKNAASPQIVLDPNNHATVIWQQFDGKKLVIQAAQVSLSNQRMSDVTHLSTDGNASNPRLAIDSLGNTIAVWENWKNGRSSIEASYKPLGSSWQTLPALLSSSNTHATHPRIGVSSCGDIYVVWQNQRDNQSCIEIAFKPFQQEWITVADPISSPSTFSEHPDIALDGYDTVGVVWETVQGSSRVIENRFQSFQEDWSAINILSNTVDYNYSPKIVADSSGNFTVVWSKFNGQKGDIQALIKLYGANWQETPTTLSFDENALSPEIAINAIGDIAVIWRAFEKNKIPFVYATAKKFEEEWPLQPEKLVNTLDYQAEPKVIFDSSRSFFAVWNSERGFSSICLLKKDIEKDLTFPPMYFYSPGRSSFSAAIASDSRNQLGLVWVQQDSLSSIRAVFGSY